jgi:hypothetical protein
MTWPVPRIAGVQGFQPAVEKCRFINGSAAAIYPGYIMAVDHVAGTNTTFGDDASMYVKLIQPKQETVATNAGLKAGWHVIVASDEEGNDAITTAIAASTGKFIGIVRGRAPNAATDGDMTKGMAMVATEDSYYLDGGQVAGHKVIAIAEEADDSATPPRGTVMFNGIEGFGQITG